MPLDLARASRAHEYLDFLPVSVAVEPKTTPKTTPKHEKKPQNTKTPPRARRNDKNPTLILRMGERVPRRLIAELYSHI